MTNQTVTISTTRYTTAEALRLVRFSREKLQRELTYLQDGGALPPLLEPLDSDARADMVRDAQDQIAVWYALEEAMNAALSAAPVNISRLEAVRHA
jgi:hypothetical protein